ncbi:hypothetical protein FIM66_01385 [Helicobacter pylori]|uniref:hypothetical protein n=1 Tax=Helicobacter pylori TaxID=210 RepID=UPI00112DF52F|nr:hypothetical protein [Helicobacter pylori]TPH62275.1 hypothetical protein FIM66_01385 [Helicobacter pylori]TPH67348.1 hypothetical protein FIM61_05145 [Helicobacter pylori]
MAIRFGVIFIVDFLRAISVDDKNKQLRSILERKKKCNSIKFYELYSSITEITAFVVFTDESDAIFNLKNYLLVLSKNFNNSRNIWYCENFVRNKEGTYNIEIELVSNGNDFGEVLDIVKDTSNKDVFNHNDLPHDLPQFLTNLMNKQIESYFHKRINNNGLPFGIIFIASNSDDPIDIDDKTKKLESCFCSDKNSDFSYFPIITEDYLILDNLKSCFVFQCKPNKNDRPFNLKQYLLGLKANLGFEPTGIFYCENANTHKIELIGNNSDFKGVLLEFLENIPQAPNELPQFLTNFKNSKSPNEKISFNFTSNKNSSISPYAAFNRKVRDTFDCYCWHGYSKIPQEKRIAKIQEQVNEEIKLDPSFCNHRVSSEQNRKINEIAEGLKSGKIIGEKIIANAFDLNAGYCFITPDDLKNLLKERLFIQQDIINAINQRVVLNHAQINDIQYNLLDNAFYFIFDIDNSPQLAIKVLRKYLENDELPNTKKNIFKRLIGNIHACIDDESSFFLENNKTIDDLNLEDLLGRLKTQAFPLSDTITNAINEKEEGVALDYALINDIKYNLLDNTFHFIFDVGNPLLKESSQLIVEVPREELDLENVDKLVECIMQSPYISYSSYLRGRVIPESSLVNHIITKGSYIIDLHLIDD